MLPQAYKFGQWHIDPSEVFAKSALSFAFVNLKPIVPGALPRDSMGQCLVVCRGAAADAACDVCSLAGHVLVAPLREAPRFRELTPEELTDIWWALFLSCM